jgi:misacylated tRNA(Ala) deacylase
MTKLLFLTDAYVKEFDAVVTEQVEGGVVLDRTAFYPGGGGQPNDVGTVTAGGQTWDVTKVKKVSGRWCILLMVRYRMWARPLPAISTGNDVTN